MSGQNIYHSQTAKFIATVVQSISGIPVDIMQDWIENPQDLNNVLIEVLCRARHGPSFKVWKTIRLGTGLKTAKDFYEAIVTSGNRIGDWGHDILNQPAFVARETEKEVSIVNISVAELGFEDGATRKDIYDRAIRLGLNLCPAEVGPQLCLQYNNKPKGEWLCVAMKPIADSGAGVSRIFCVGHDGVVNWFFGVNGSPDSFWSGCSRWLFLGDK